jgi:hypothetical protein
MAIYVVKLSRCGDTVRLTIPVALFRDLRWDEVRVAEMEQRGRIVEVRPLGNRRHKVYPPRPG